MEIVDKLKAQAIEIANEGHNGWGNTMTEAAEEIESLKAQTAPVAEVPYSDGLSLLADKKRRCNARIEELKNAKDKTVFHSNGIFAEQIKKLIIDEIIAEFKAAR